MVDEIPEKALRRLRGLVHWEGFEADMVTVGHSLLWQQPLVQSVRYVELDIIKELLLRLKSATLRDEVEQLLHEHVFTEGSFLLSKEDFVFKWEVAHPRHRGRSPSQRLHKPPKVFLKLQDLRPPAAPPAEVQEVMQKLGPSELLRIMQRRRSQPDKKSRVPPKYIGRARPVEQKVELVSETVEVHKRLQLMRQS